MTKPFFSILIPSRERVDLLKKALESISRQSFDDYEVIVSDNCSSIPYRNDKEITGHQKLQLIRTEYPISVTENWNFALKHATGNYIIMLGDDDALTPGALGRFASWINEYSQPDYLYVMAYHYCYPGVFPTKLEGYFSIVANSSLFLRHNTPYFLNNDEALKFSLSAMQFHHDVSFNAQHYIWKKSFIQELSQDVFFNSVYPDYYATFISFAKAEKILVVPSPEMIIGISPKSFGFYYARDQQEVGFHQFLTEKYDFSGMENKNSKIRDALAFPGSTHIRNWLQSALLAEKKLGYASSTALNISRYRSAQIIELFKSSSTRDLFRLLHSYFFSLEERQLIFKQILLRLVDYFKPSSNDAKNHIEKLEHQLSIYFPACVTNIDIGNHSTIIDAYNYLENCLSQKQ